MSKRAIITWTLVAAGLVLGLGAKRFLAFLEGPEQAEIQAIIPDTGDLYWDDPAVPQGYRACTLLGFEDAQLIERVKIIRLDDNATLSDRTRDTGIRAPGEIGAGLFASNPFTMTVDEGDLEPGVAHQVRYCHHWQVTDAICEGWSEPMTATVCLILVEDGTMPSPDTECCYDGPVVEGLYEIYAPLILKGYGK